MNHELKTDPAVFAATASGHKTAELRFNDRNFNVGDTLTEAETKYSAREMADGAPLIFTGRKLIVTVTHILVGYGLADGWIMMSHDRPRIIHY